MELKKKTYNRKTAGNYQNAWILNSTFLDNPWDKYG